MGVPRIAAAAVLALSLSAAAAAAQILPAVLGGSPAAAPDQRFDIAYGSDALNKMDVCSPPALPAGKTVPAFVLIHQGGWSAGDKDADLVLVSHCMRLALRGYVAFAINYRLVSGTQPTATNAYPTPVCDAQLAVRYIRQNAPTYNVDPNRIFAMGNSSGAHMAAELAVWDTIIGGCDNAGTLAAVSPKAQGAIGNSTPGDLTWCIDSPTPNDSNWSGEKNFVNADCIEASRGSFAAASPNGNVAVSTSPMSLNQGTTDNVVQPTEAANLIATLTASGVANRYATYSGGHVFSGLTAAQTQCLIDTSIDWLISGGAAQGSC